MDLEVDLASLEITDQRRKRRYSGVFKKHTLLQPSSNLDSSNSDNENISDDNGKLSVETATINNNTLRRSTRKKIRTIETECKRRVLMQPKKLSLDSNMKEIENYYLDKRIKRLPPTLETIYEEPQSQNSKGKFMSTKKFKRVINFEDYNNKNAAKIKKRKLKAKTHSAIKRHHMKVSIELLMDKLKALED